MTGAILYNHTVVIPVNTPRLKAQAKQYNQHNCSFMKETKSTNFQWSKEHSNTFKKKYEKASTKPDCRASA
jgi:hypothetical protein